MQEKDFLNEIKEICHEIWSDKDGITQKSGKVIVKSVPVLQNILTEVETGRIQGISANKLLQVINELMEGLQYKDQYYLADILYFKLSEIIKIYEKERRKYEPV